MGAVGWRFYKNLRRQHVSISVANIYYVLLLFNTAHDCDMTTCSISLYADYFLVGIELLKDVDSNAKDYSYQHKFPEFPEVPRPILAAAWESNNYDAVDVLLEMEPDTRALWTDDAESKNPPKPLFFQVKIRPNPDGGGGGNISETRGLSGFSPKKNGFAWGFT